MAVGTNTHPSEEFQLQVDSEALLASSTIHCNNHHLNQKETTIPIKAEEAFLTVEVEADMELDQVAAVRGHKDYKELEGPIMAVEEGKEVGYWDLAVIVAHHKGMEEEIAVVSAEELMHTARAVAVAHK